LVVGDSGSNSGCLESFLLGFVEFGFRITLEFEGSSSSVQAGSDILLLCGLLLV